MFFNLNRRCTRCCIIIAIYCIIVVISNRNHRTGFIDSKIICFYCLCLICCLILSTDRKRIITIFCKCNGCSTYTLIRVFRIFGCLPCCQLRNHTICIGNICFKICRLKVTFCNCNGSNSVLFEHGCIFSIRCLIIKCNFDFRFCLINTEYLFVF